MLYHVTVGGRTFEVEFGADGIEVDGRQVDAELAALGGTPVRGLRLDGASYRVVAHPEGRGGWRLNVSGHPIEAEVVDERTRAIRELTGAIGAASGPKPVTAPMPGLVVQVEVTEGDEVQPGQGVVIVEAMKMENELKAEVPCVVGTVHVAAGDTVEKGQVLVDFLSPDAEDE
ncbi:MAG: biotin/lipoyl-containing protein [Gemmatimonadota bacterium]|nr:biotin/lipoyl-containing protein [Gemmatimonadota bacterium]